MHEMPYTQAMIDLALKEAGGANITCIHLRVGWMSAIVPQSVQAFFDYLSQGTPAEGAELVFDMVPIWLTCNNCKQSIELPYDPETNPRRALADVFRNGCACGAGQFKITDGLGFDLGGITVEGNADQQ